MGKFKSTAGRIIVVLAMVLGAGLSGCEKKPGVEAGSEAAVQRTQVTDGGAKLLFPAGDAGLDRIQTVTAKKRTVTVPVFAPAHVVASIAAGLSSADKVVLFETPDATSLYSQYRQNRANMERTSRNLERVRTMFENQTATAKDLNEAQTDDANARASMAEAEAKLREVGLNPVTLDHVAGGTVWLISDVPESQLSEVQQGEEVDLTFSSFPGVTFRGRVEGIGEVVDPVTRTVKVRVSTPNPKGRLIPGMFGRVDYGDPRDDVVVLPATCVITAEGSDYVFVRNSDTEFERRQVSIAASDADEVIVLKGIRDGDRVVSAGAMLLKGLSFGY